MFRRADRNRLRNLLITYSPSSVDEHSHGIPHLETLLIFQLLVVESCWVWVQNTRSKLCRESNETDVSWSATVIGYLRPNMQWKGLQSWSFCTKINQIQILLIHVFLWQKKPWPCILIFLSPVSGEYKGSCLNRGTGGVGRGDRSSSSFADSTSSGISISFPYHPSS